MPLVHLTGQGTTIERSRTCSNMAGSLEGTSRTPEELSFVSKLLQEDLALTAPPVQVTYLDARPTGPVEVGAPLPSVCSYFIAGREKVIAADRAAHESCEIGAFVLGIPPKGTLGSRLGSTVEFFERVGYLAHGEAARIPRNPHPPSWVLYAPLGGAPQAPSVVLFTVSARGLMLVVESTTRGEPGLPPAPLLSRPMCGLVPVLLSGTPVAISVGCAGSRVHTGMRDDEVMVGVRGDALMALADRIHQLRRANELVWKEEASRRSDFLQIQGASPARAAAPPRPA